MINVLLFLQIFYFICYVFNGGKARLGAGQLEAGGVPAVGSAERGPLKM